MDTGENVSDRTRLTALLLALFTGLLGGHRFYAGKVGTGIAMLCTFGGFGIWWLFDCILIVSGEFRDIHGRRIARWTMDDPLPDAVALPPGAEQRVLAALDEMRTDVFELEERMDFMERLLTEVRERMRQVPPR